MISLFRLCSFACQGVPSPFFKPVFLLLLWITHSLMIFLALYSFVVVALSAWFAWAFVIAPFDGGIAIFRFCEEIDIIAMHNQGILSIVMLTLSAILTIYLLANYGEWGARQ
jgi:hypothetical protein